MDVAFSNASSASSRLLLPQRTDRLHNHGVVDSGLAAAPC
jgi:hypothetical protein